MFTTKDIAIVILNWNGQVLLEQFLPSIVAYSEGARIYVADNASRDNSVSFLNTEYPQIINIQNVKNYGYAKGYNLALSFVDEPLICLLNNDIEVTKNWLNPILDEFNLEPNTAIIQPKILDYNNKSFFEYAGAAGGFIDKYGYPFCRGRIFDTIEEDKNQYNKNTTIFWASGSCFFIRNSVYQSLNGFDVSYFAHMEEIDLCWRAFNAGYITKYIGKSTVYHIGGSTLKSSNPQKTYLNFRNSLFTLLKNTDSNVCIRILTRLLLDCIAALRFLVTLKPNHFIAILKAHFSFYKNLNTLLILRKKLPKKEKYYKVNSIVWLYFIKKNKSLQELS